MEALERALGGVFIISMLASSLVGASCTVVQDDSSRDDDMIVKNSAKSMTPSRSMSASAIICLACFVLTGAFSEAMIILSSPRSSTPLPS